MKIYKKFLAAVGMMTAFSAGAAITSFAATGWSLEGDTWYYYDKDSSRVTDEWKKSGENWFYLGDDGSMVKSSLIQTNDDYYYVNSSGAMVSNQWREFDNTEFDEEDSPETYWYYFQNNGKAYRATGDKTSFKTIKKADGSLKKYAFDSEGRMLTGWVGENSERITGDDAWASALYYCGEADDGAQANNTWAKISVVDSENDDDLDQDYWFYFNSAGKKISNQTKTINGRKYLFDERGAAQYEWHQNMATATASPANGYSYYNSADKCWRAAGWFYTVPTEEINPDAYHDDEAFWFYADKSGKLITSQLKNINGNKYAFNERGEMLSGLYLLEFEDGSNSVITNYTKIEEERDLPEFYDSGEVYYFGSNPDGSMKIGNQSLEIDGEKYSYGFKKTGSNKGAGYNGIYDNAIYQKGRKLKADNDSKYIIIEFEDKDYLVNTSGSIMKGKANVKDGDEIYYCTDKSGVVTYQGFEKYTK